MGSFLEFSQEEMNEIENTESNEIQKCERLLRLWRSREKPYGPQALTSILRRAGFFYIAGIFTFLFITAYQNVSNFNICDYILHTHVNS